MNAEEIFKKINLDDDAKNAVFDFYVVWSRFECVLKRNGFSRPGRDGTADVDWENLYAALDGIFNKTLELKLREFCSYLLKNPPKRLKHVYSAAPVWNPMPDLTKRTLIVDAVKLTKQVRNNLFHGGKYSNALESEIGRDTNLIKQSLAVVGMVLDSIPGLKDSFHEF